MEMRAVEYDGDDEHGTPLTVTLGELRHQLGGVVGRHRRHGDTRDYELSIEHLAGKPDATEIILELYTEDYEEAVAQSLLRGITPPPFRLPRPR